MKRHLKHVAMCSPMIIVVAVLLATGSGITVFMPLIGCMLMMGVMMAMMSGGSRS